MTDYDAARAKMKRLVDKPSEDTNKLPRVSFHAHLYDGNELTVQAQQEHDEARDIFNILNEQLVTELPQFVDLRIRTSHSSPCLVCGTTNNQPTSTHHSKPWFDVN
jgi:hypothetical protein